MDGVIIDSEPIHAKVNHLTLKKYNVDVPSEYYEQFIGSTLRYMCERLVVDYKMNTTVDELFQTNVEIKNRLILEEGYPPVPYVINLIKNLYDNGLKLIIASSSTSEMIERVLEMLKIKEYFVGYVSGNQIKNPKPSPDIFLKALEILKLEPKECIVIEDSMHGVNASYAAGIPCIGYVNPNSGKQNLKKASFLVEGFEEIDYEYLLSIYNMAAGLPKIIINSNRLYIRELSLDDFETLYSIYQKDEIKKFVDNISDSKEEEFQKLVAYIQNIYRYYNYGLWGVYLNHNNKLIGKCGIELKVNHEITEYEIGFFLDPTYWGNGYASEFVKAVIDYSFQKLNISNIVAYIDSKNNPSQRLVEHIGFYKTHEFQKNLDLIYKYNIKNPIID